MSDWPSWKFLGTRSLVARFTGLGVVAGVVSWGLAFLIYPLLEAERPGWPELLLAVTVGALEGVALAPILRSYWNRSGRTRVTR